MITFLLDFHTPKEDSILCTCCKKYLSDDDEAGGSPYMEMCADCLKCFDEDSQQLPNDVDSVSTFEKDHKENSPLVGDGEDSLTETPLKGLLPHLGSSPPTCPLCLLPPVPKVVIADKVLPGSILSAMKNDAKSNQQTMAQLLKSLYSVFSALTWETETSVTVSDSVRNFNMLSFRSD